LKKLNGILDQGLSMSLRDTSMVHKQGITPVSNQRLQRRSGVYYYRRRVPLHLVAKLGKKFVQVSLQTNDLKEAKKRRTLHDLEWDAKFATCSSSANGGDGPAVQTSALAQPLSETELVQVVRDYVARRDQLARKREVTDYPENPAQRAEMTIESEVESQILQSRDNPQAQQWIYLAGQEALKPAGRSFEDPAIPGEALAELVRRALLELTRRRHARLADDHSRSFFDQLFDPSRAAKETFGKVAEQHLRLVEEDAAINGLGAKGLDRQRATITLIREIVGDETPVDAIDYDACLRVRTTVARLPAKGTKLYADLPIDQAIARAEKDGKPLLSPVTQERYLVALRDILDLAAKKRLITVNPAEGLKPLKRDAVAAGDKRKSFTLQQIADFFKSDFYTECAKHPPAFAHDKHGWRFWLPLLCLFLGMRPNEAAQLHLPDLKRTKNNTWYLDIEATVDEDEESNGAVKTLKTATSRRKIPLHPELIKIGFVQFVEQRTKASSGPRLFPDLKPDTYGNHASYALKRFRETYLRGAIKMEPRQSFYSFRHSWRDALRRIDAPPATLAAVGGWSQGKLTSDAYGDASDPDYQIKIIRKISFPGLDLFPLHSKCK
jgi:integrase